MRFGERYESRDGGRPIVSFEVFPPKTESAHASFAKILPELVELGPDFITVTYGAMGTTRDSTIEIASDIKERYGVHTACHLTCVGSTAEAIDSILDRIESCGIENIVALRGDPPRGEKRFVPVEGGYCHAIELVRHVAGRDRFGIAVAGYPEKHIEAPDIDTDIRFLKEKVDAGADLVITQLFYDNSSYFDFVARARDAGISCPIVPGILPIVSAKQIRRITSMCGAAIPADLQERLDAAGDDAAASLDVGVRQAVEQVRDLLERGVPGVHFYVLNRSSHMQRIAGELGLTS